MQLAMQPGRPAIIRRPRPYHLDLECLEQRTLLDASFQGLGFLPGGIFSYAYSVSADGSVVVGGARSADGMDVPFRWNDETGMVRLGDLGGTGNGVSADGLVVAGDAYLENGRLREGFFWTAQTGMQLLGFLHSGDIESPGTAISEDGRVIVGFSSPGGFGNPEAYLWNGGMFGLGFLPGGMSSTALGVSGDGEVVVGQSNSKAFRWTFSTGMVDLGELPGNGSGTYAHAVSANGEVVVGNTNGDTTFRWTAATGMVRLGSVPGSDVSFPYAVSGNGSIVVGDYVGGGTFRAAIWDSIHGARDLRDALITDFGLGPELRGWQLTQALGISPDGRSIVGYGDNPTGQSEAWLVRLPPLAPPTITCSVADVLLWPPNRQLDNVGLRIDVQPPDATVQVQVYANDNANASDAADIAPNTLELRAARRAHGNGRVYLIVVTATAGGQTAFDVCTVVVPHDQSAGSIAQVQADAAAAEAYYRQFQTPPPGYNLLGEGSSNTGGNGSRSLASSLADGVRVVAFVSAPTAPTYSPTAGIVPATDLSGNALVSGAVPPVDGYFVLRSEEEGVGELDSWLPDVWLNQDRLFA
jgi:probable HAF family extracellular repeat protein